MDRRKEEMKEKGRKNENRARGRKKW